jgi:hypothetical protein
MFHLVTECNRLGTPRGFSNEIWGAYAYIARVTHYSYRAALSTKYR